MLHLNIHRVDLERASQDDIAGVKISSEAIFNHLTAAIDSIDEKSGSTIAKLEGWKANPETGKEDLRKFIKRNRKKLFHFQEQNLREKREECFWLRKFV